MHFSTKQQVFPPRLALPNPLRIIHHGSDNLKGVFFTVQEGGEYYPPQQDTEKVEIEVCEVRFHSIGGY